MPLTRDFKETVKARAEKDIAFREALLTEALDCFLAGDTGTGKIMLRDYINCPFAPSGSNYLNFNLLIFS